MGVVTGSKKRKLQEDEEQEELAVDRISRLPDDVLGDIISLLPTTDAARTQVISHRWLPLWRAAPLNLDLSGPGNQLTLVRNIGRILSSHPGPGRRFSIQMVYVQTNDSAAALDAWLRSPALDNLQELEFCLRHTSYNTLPPLPASVRRFSSTLRVATFERCSFPDNALQLPLLEQLSLVDVRISETSLHALLAGCSVLESLLLLNICGFSRLQIVPTSLRSIGLSCSHWGHDMLKQFIIEDAPCLERLLVFQHSEMDVSVISAPILKILGELSREFPRLQFGTTTFHGANMVSLTTVVRSVKVLALSRVPLSLDAVIDLIKCFPCLEKLYIQTVWGRKNTWCRKYRNLIGAFDIRLKKIVLSYYRGKWSHVNFAKFFVSNATVLESMRFELEDDRNINSVWIERQHRLLQIENKASRDAQFYFVFRNEPVGLFYSLQTRQEQVHDLSTDDPFERIYN
ncbi:unnamed protein product [Urochloa humidicola]